MFLVIRQYGRTHSPNANDRYDLASAIRIRAGAHSFEGKVFNIVASSIIDEKTKKILSDEIDGADQIINNTPKGLSMIVGPDGMPIVETNSDKDTILSQEIDLNKCIITKQFHDLAGYYNDLIFLILKLIDLEHSQSK